MSANLIPSAIHIKGYYVLTVDFVQYEDSSVHFLVGVRKHSQRLLILFLYLFDLQVY